MGDTQSAQRAGKDAAAEEESEKVNDGQTVQNTEDEPLKNNGQISEINGKADGSIAALNGHCEDKIPAEGNVAETEKPLKEEEETPLKNVEISQNKLPDEVDANEVEPAEIIEMEEKQNDINESFRKFFSNIGLKLTVKKGSGEKGETDVPKEGPNIPEEVTDNVQEVKSENEDQNVALNAAQEANDYDSTTCPTMTDGTSENFLGNAETKTTETTEEAESDSADAGTTSPAVSEDAHQDTIPEEEPRPKSPLITDEIVVESPFKRFFTTGIFSSLRKKKKLAEDEAIEKELVDMGENEPAEIAEQAFEEEQQDKEEITLDTEAITTVKGLREAELLPAVSIQVKDEVKSPSMDTSDSIVNEAEILNSQEKEKVQASPLKKLMSGSSFKNLSKKQKGKKSSDAKISDPQQQISDQLLSSTDSAEYQKEESPTQPSAPAAEDEDGAWAAFKKLVTPKKRIKKSSLSNEQGQISGSVDEAKLSEEQQISDHSTDEGKKRKDSSVSWEAVLCGSGRRRSRKSSDSEEETPQTSAGDSKQDSGLKQGAESPLERSNEVQKIQEGSPSEGDGESTWKSFKKLVTPKTKAKDEDESKDTSPSDDQVTQADSTFSIKKLLPGRKKRKPAEKPDQVSSDEADKDVASGDEDSETPAVIPLSEFDADETDVHTQTKTGVESYVPEQTDSELRQESAPPCDSLQIETQKVLDNEDALENEASKTPVEENTVEEPDDLTELISKYQQLSDIPEEGILTETMATPASVIEEAARDDTIAEDLVEITSEAITAPEPVDATATDETEMISAVSQLSDSSKTSGNVTPVPAEYSVKDTELLLEQVAENISASPHTVTVTSEEPSSERIVSSALPQILETFEKEQLKILEIHKGSDETVINTDLNTEPIDVINELAAIVQTESVPDVNKAISTEIVSQVHTEEFDNAEITVDEVHEVSVIQGQENIKELEATDDSRHVPESVSEEKEELPQETSPEGKEVVPDAGSVVGADQVEEDTLKTETQEAESASFVADENKNGSMEQEAQTPAEKRDQIIQIVTEESQVEDHASVVVVDELEAPTNVEKDAIASENDSVQSLEKETPSSEDIPPADVVTDESKQREHLTEVTVEPENTETQTEAPQIDHYEVTDVLEVEQKATVDTEENSGQLPKEEVRSSEDIPPVESTDESKQRAEHLTEVTNEPETKEPHPDISEVTDVSEVVQATLESEGDHVQKEIQSSEDIHSAEPVTDESKQTAEHLPEVTDEFQNKEPQVEVPEEIDVQAATLYPEERSIQSLDKEVISEDIPPAETDQPKETEMVPLTEDKVEAVDDSKTEDVQEPAVVQAFTLDSEEDSVQKEIKSSEDIPPAESIDESKQTAEHLTTVIDEIQNKEPQVEVPEEMEVVQAATFDSEERSIQSLDKEVISEDIPPPKTDQPKEAEMVPLTEDKVEAVDDSKTENVKEPAVVQAITVSEAGSSQVIEEEVISKDMVVAETVIDEPRQETVELEKVELVEAEISLPDIVPETDDKISKANVFAQSVEEICTQELETETLLEDVPKLDTDSVTDEAEKKVEAQPDQDLEINKDKKTESIPQGVRAEHEDRKAEAVEKTVTAAHVPSGAEASHDQVLEETVFCEEILAPCVESAEVSEEPKHEEDLSIDQVSVEGEKADELQGTEMNTAAAEHAVVMQVITYNLKDVSAAIPDVLIEETPEIQERSIERNANEMEVKAPVETTTPLEKDNVNNTAGEGSMVVMMHVPSVEFDDNHRIQVQVVDIAIKSAENIVDTMIEAGVTEAKEVIDVCHETLEKVETLSASPALEEEVNNEENNLTIQEVIQHVKENLPETTPESPEPDLLEQEVMKQADVSELVQSGSSELEDQKMMKDSAGAHMEEKDEEHVIPAEQKVSEAQLQRSDLSLEISTQDRKEDLEETKAELQKSEVCVTTEAATASSEKKTEKKVEAQPDQDLKINKDKKTESIPQGVQVEHEDRKAEAVEETVTAAHVPSGAEASHDQVLEETVFCEEILAPCVESAEVSEEPKHEEDLSIDQVSVEGEKADELQGTEMHTAAAEHAVVMQVITCNLKDVSAAIPDVLIEETPEIQERSIERNANEIEVKAPVETTTPLEKDNVNKTTGEGSMVVMMHVPSVEFDDNHRIQVQVVDIAIKSAENIVDTMIEAGVTEAKEVIDVCHETLEKVETLSASPALEEEVNNEENNLTIQEVIQHVKENLPETTPESPEPDLLEQEVMKKADVSELVQSGSSELEDQKMMKDSAGAHMEEKDEEHVIPAEQKVSEAQLQRSDLSLEISTQDRKEDLEETKAELQKSEVCVTTEAATASSEELSNKKDAENTTEGQRPQSTQSQIVTPSNTGLVAPQNTGMISSIGNVESPSSLSLEFKLNIQFGQPKAPASPPPPKEPMKQPDMSAVAVQAAEADDPTNVINAMQRLASEKQIELMEAAVQTTEITEPGAVISYQPKLQDGAVQKIETTQPVKQIEPIIPRNREAETAEPVKQITEPAEKADLTERAVMSYQPVPQDIGIQAMETIVPVEQIQSEQSIIPIIQAAEIIEPVRPKEKRGVLLSHPAVFEPFFEAHDKGKKAEEPIKQTDEENDDVWLDAEEDIYTQEETEVSRLKVEEPTEPQAESEPEFEMAPDSKTEDGESHQRVLKTGRTCELESEGEDFAVALEYPETTISVPPAEWD